MTDTAAEPYYCSNCRLPLPSPAHSDGKCHFGIYRAGAEAGEKPWRDGVAARVPDTFCPEVASGPADLLPGLDAAIAEAVAAERERCLAIVEQAKSDPWYPLPKSDRDTLLRCIGWEDAADAIAAAIRGGDDG